MNTIGIFMEGPNTGASLFCDGKLIAAQEEERFTRQKRAPDVFPARAVAYCLAEAGLKARDVDVVAAGWDHNRYPQPMDHRMRSIAGRTLDPIADRVESMVHIKLSPELATFKISAGMKQLDQQADCEIRFFPHHLCHAASVHYLSGFESSSILVLDGSGEEIGTSTWFGAGDEIRLLDKWLLPDSLGWFYAVMTEYLGFKAYSGEGKVMGLAPYGQPDPELAAKLRRFCLSDPERIYKIDPRFLYGSKRSHSWRFTDHLTDLFGPPRLPESELSDRDRSLAFEVQRRLEEIATDLAHRLLAETGCGNLCISGGVAMNCKMNGVLSKLEGVENVFINPASHDSGTAVGAALLAIKESGASPGQNVLHHAYLGPGYSEEQIESALRHCGVAFRRSENAPGEAARIIAAGKIAGWFHGRSEFGSRALGARSILANPLLADTKDRVNAHVKYREAFRPFAPSLLEEARDTYLVDARDSPFMILAYRFREEYEELFPSIVHVDGSVRPQTVSKTTNPCYWELIHSFGNITGHPVVLNTSLNVRGEPIANTPLDALRCFFSTGMDALVMPPFIVEKPGSTAA